MSKREKQVIEMKPYSDSIFMNIYMHMLVTVEKKNREIFPHIVGEKFSEKLDDTGISFSMIYVL